MSRALEFVKSFELKVEKIEVDGRTIHIRQLNADEGLRFMDEDLSEQQIARDLARMSICDAQGARIFGDDDDKAFGSIPFHVLFVVSSRAADFNGLTKTAGKESSS